MLTVTCLVVVCLAADAVSLARRNRSEAIILSEEERTVTPKYVIDVYYGTIPTEDSLADQQTVKDEPIGNIRYPAINSRRNNLKSEPKNATRTRPNSTFDQMSDTHNRVGQDSVINDDFKVYFGSDNERTVTAKISKPVAEDDGKIYFEPALPRKNTTEIVEKKSEVDNIMKIEPGRRKNETTTATPAVDGVALDNRNAFSADVPCEKGLVKVMGKCIQAE